MEDDGMKLRQEITTLSEIIAGYDTSAMGQDKDLHHIKNLLQWKKSLLTLVESELKESRNSKPEPRGE